MLALDLALALRDAGLRWAPQPGDRFVLPGRGMDDDVFVLSNMTVEVHEFPTGKVIGFNGVTEWALDSVDQDDAIWLPREDQLRDLLGGTFRSLARSTDGTYQVLVEKPGRPEQVFSADNAPDAYAYALLSLVTAAVERVR